MTVEEKAAISASRLSVFLKALIAILKKDNIIERAALWHPPTTWLASTIVFGKWGCQSPVRVGEPPILGVHPMTEASWPPEFGCHV